MNQHSISQQQESGFALIAALIILLVITIIGISGMDETIMEERMITNFQDRAIADNAAEASIRKAELWLAKQINKPDEMTSADCSTPPLCGSSAEYVVWDSDQVISAGADWSSMSWSDWTSDGVVYEGSSSTSSAIYGVVAQPRALIEFRTYNPQSSSGMVEVTNVGQSNQGVGAYYYNIVAAGVGGREETLAVVETTNRQWY